MGFAAQALWGQLAAEALCDNPEWVDGKPFFVTNRKLGGAKIDNLVSGALTPETFTAARAKMMGFTAADGKTSLGLNPNVLIVGPALESTARRILEGTFVVEGGAAVDNPCKGLATGVVDPNIVGTHANLWFLACTDRGVQPVIVQQREIGKLVRVDADESEPVKNKNECEYYIRSRGAATLTLPQLVIRGGY